MGEKYLAIKNWEKFQPTDRLRNKHAKLPWIKIYLDLEFDPDFQRLSCFQRGLLQGIWCLRGRFGKNPYNDVMWISRSLNVLPEERHLVGRALRRLIADGWFIPTSDVYGEGKPPVSTLQDTSIPPASVILPQSNQPLDSRDREREGDRDGDREEQKQVAILPKLEPRVVTPKEGKLAVVEVKAFELPVWIHRETWMDFELMRKKIGKPLTNRARELIVRKLLALMDQGHPPQQVLEESIVNNWAGVFELKGNRNGGTRQASKSEQREQRGREVIQSLARDIYGGDGMGQHDMRAQTDGPSRQDGDETDMVGAVVILPPTRH